LGINPVCPPEDEGKITVRTDDVENPQISKNHDGAEGQNDVDGIERNGLKISLLVFPFQFQQIGICFGEFFGNPPESFLYINDSNTSLI
jgi:hypothetical protein